MDNDKFYKVVMTHLETLDPDVMGAINCGEMPRPERAICRTTYHRTAKGARLEVEGILKDHWFKDADIITATSYIWHCSKLRADEIHAPGHKAYNITQVLYKEIRIEAYTIRD